ncbi:MAG TPA: methyltransferase domain-containing protein [Gaiellaceae bacterium]
MSEYLLASQQSERDRLRVQSEVWEPAGRALLARLGPGEGRRALDVGCGALGWLRVLVEAGWETVGADYDAGMLEAARTLGLPVELVEDDLFASRLPADAFDLVHARFELCPLGRWDEQLAVYRRWLRPGGVLVLEDPDSRSWGYSPPAPAADRLIELIRRAFAAAGSDFDAGRALPALLRGIGVEPDVDAHVVALPPGHPYLRSPLQFAGSLRPRLVEFLPEPELDELLADVERELADPERWGLPFTLVQAWGRV